MVLCFTQTNKRRFRYLMSVAAAALAFWSQPSSALTVDVVDGNGQAVTTGFRWLLEQDTTTVTVPGAQVANSVSLSINRSYCPVVTNGHAATASVVIGVPATNRYILSVLPDSGYTLGAATVTNGQTAATVTVHATPVPTAQITIEAFEDHSPINNARDATEPGLSGFKVVISDAMGMVSQDAFGNMLGTSYQQDTNGEFILDGDGAPVVEMMGNGEILTDVNGTAVIKNLMPARFAVQVIPPVGETWHQTSTIDGTPNIDAWVKLNEPAALIEFGLISRHVSYGFVNPSRLPWALSPPAGGATITGRLVDNHFSKPPAINSSFPGAPVPEGLIGLNRLAPEAGLYAADCAADGTFVISNVPPGTYQLVTWDKPLDLTIGFNTVVVSSNGEVVALGDVLCGRWHGWLRGSVFYDSNENGFRDDGEVGMANQTVNIRNREGTVLQSTVTDVNGDYSFREILLFFKWYVAEVNYDRFKPTGMTVVSDGGGGPIPPADGWVMPSFGLLNPQPQYATDPVTGLVLTNSLGEMIPLINPNTGNNLSRTETGPVLLEAMMNFQANVIDWGKVNYATNENGGIAGIVYYDTTRAENDARLCVGEPWEPGIPRVQVNLYTDADHNKAIDDLNHDGRVTLADVDNHPFGWQDGSAPKGPEDTDRNTNGVFNAGDAIQIVHTDSWDDNMPQGSIQTHAPLAHGQPVKPGYDSFGTWDQVRPGVFDGGYWFNSYFPGGMATNDTNEVSGLPPGTYIVESVPPPGYELVKEESKNVDFGDAYTPSKLQLLPECVGDPHVVPAELSLFPGVPAVLAGQTNRLADRRLVTLNALKNANCDFFFFTPVPKAARAVGLVTDDLHSVFDPAHPFYGEKATPSWIPISFRDFAGNEVARVYCDEYGVYTAMLPSTYSVNVPTPSGVSPMMLQIVLNDPTMPDPANPGQQIADPFYDPDFSVNVATFDFWPGTISYPDTPTLPQGAFVGYPNGRMDIEPADGTPEIRSAQGPDYGALIAAPGDILKIKAVGPTQVPNPLYNTTNGAPLLITRDFGFGTVQGTVTVNGMPLTILSWEADKIRVTAPANVPSGQLMIKRGDNGLSTRIGLTLTVGAPTGTVHHVTWAPYPAHPIQDAIDAAQPGDLILVGPGAYDENPILWKPVKLQGSGAQSTFIKAAMSPSARNMAWHDKVQALLGTPGADPFSSSDAPGILVLGDAGFAFGEVNQARIDGFTIVGAAVGGGIMVHTRARYLQISNNRLMGNNGTYAGAISVGTPETGVSASNDHVSIRFNEILKNGSAGRAGVAGAGGIGLYTGADDYEVSDNIIQGNLSTANGAGLAHIGLSQRGQIARNRILFNEATSDLAGLGYGGGLYLAGEAPALGGLTPGAGTVTVEGNLIQGNLSGAGHGGGIRAESFNGQDVADKPGNTNKWHALNLFNNIIVNNVAGYAGGGVSLQDVARGAFIHNTVANNDSAATASEDFPAAGGNSEPQGAGLVGHPHSEGLAAASGQSYSSPVLYDDIFWHNRSYYVDTALNGGAGGLAPNPASPYWDLQLFGTAAKPSPRSCILSSTAGYHASNLSANPFFVNQYVNSNIISAVPDEAGNSVSLRFSPIYPTGDYHIKSASPARDVAESSFLAVYPALRSDGDTDYRPAGAKPDIGADEYVVASVFAAYRSYFVNENSALTVGTPGVLANSLPAGATAELVSGPSHGTLPAFNSNGSFTYQPAVNFSGQDTFFFRARSGAARSRVSQVTITVRPANSVPVAVPDAYTVNGNSVFTVAAPGLLANDQGFDGVPLTARPVSGPAHGTLTLNHDGSFTYTPVSGFVGTDSFVYKAKDGQQSSTQAPVTLTVTAPMPDFVVTAIMVAPAVVGTNALFDATVTVKNTGTAAGPAGRLSVWRDQPGADVPAGTTGEAYADLGVLNAGASTTVTFAALAAPAITPPAFPPYAATFRAFVNSAATAPEFASGNNQRLASYTVAKTVGLADAYPADLDGVDTDGDGNVSNDYIFIRLAAGDGFIKMADDLDMYVFGFSDATGLTEEETMMRNMMYAGTPAPTMVFREGQRVYLKLTNVGMMMRPDLFDPHTVHFHGFPNAAPIFDGEPMASVSINMGSTFTYYYEPVEPGTFMYHCHVEAPEHMQMGMLGMVWVLPKQDRLPDNADLDGFTHHTGYTYAYNDGDGSTYYDVDLPLQITGMDRKFHDAEIEVQPLPLAGMKDDYFLLNGRGYPDTVNTNSLVNLNGDPVQAVHAKRVVQAGDKVLLRISSLATVDFTTLASSLPMTVVARSARLLRGPDPAGGGVGKNLFYKTTSITLGGGESFDAIIDTAGVAPGTYFIYSTNLDQLNNGAEENGGIMTEIEIQ